MPAKCQKQAFQAARRPPSQKSALLCIWQRLLIPEPPFHKGEEPIQRRGKDAQEDNAQDYPVEFEYLVLQTVIIKIYLCWSCPLYVSL